MSKGENKGAFTGTKGLALERNSEYPIRCTVQYYNVTDSPDITHEQLKEIGETVKKLYTGATATGSLVVGKSERVTEQTQESKRAKIDSPIASFL